MKGVIARFPKKGAGYIPSGSRLAARQRRAELTRSQSAAIVANQTATECADMRNRGSKRNDASDGCSADAALHADPGNPIGAGGGWRGSPKLATDFADTSCDDVVSDMRG